MRYDLRAATYPLLGSLLRNGPVHMLESIAQGNVGAYGAAVRDVSGVLWNAQPRFRGDSPGTSRDRAGLMFEAIYYLHDLRKAVEDGLAHTDIDQRTKRAVVGNLRDARRLNDLLTVIRLYPLLNSEK